MDGWLWLRCSCLGVDARSTPPPLGAEICTSTTQSHSLFIHAQVSKEGDTFEVPVEIAKLSNLVVTTLGEDDDEEDSVEIPLPNVKANVLAKVIEYCTHYKKEEASE